MRSTARPRTLEGTPLTSAPSKTVLRSTILAVTLAGILTLATAGCSGLEDPSPGRARNEGWATARLPNTSRVAAFDAANGATSFNLSASSIAGS